MNKAYILCSGGLDSVSAAYFAKKKMNYDRICLVFFDYGQRNLKSESSSARYFARQLGADFIWLDARWISKIGKSGLTTNSKPVNLKGLRNTKKESEQWYVPCRNIVFLTQTITLIEARKDKADIIVGFKNEGREFFKDASPRFVRIFNKLALQSTESMPRVIAPLIKKDKEDIIILAKKLGVNLDRTYSCYTGGKIHCGRCLSCRLRKAGFYWAGIKDYTKYLS